MTIRDFEDLQAVYQDYAENEKYWENQLEDSCEICERIIILRLQELFKAAKKLAVDKKLLWSGIPLLVTAHDYDMVYEAAL